MSCPVQIHGRRWEELILGERKVINIYFIAYSSVGCSIFMSGREDVETMIFWPKTS